MKTTAPQYAVVYSGPHYGRRHRVLARHDGPTRRVTVQDITSGDIRVVPACDVEPVPAPKPAAQPSPFVNPSALRPGCTVTWGRGLQPRTFVFIRQKEGKCVFRCDDYRGFDGPNDPGLVTMSRVRVIRECRNPLAA
jgi:hypothetical protein